MELLIAGGIYKAHLLMRPRERWPQGRIARYRAARLAGLRAHALRHSSFYREFHPDGLDRPLERLPTLTKATVMANFDRLVTDPKIRLGDAQRHVRDAQGEERYLGRYRVQLTSGTTGRVGLTLFDRAAWTGLLSSWVRAEDWAGLPINPVKRTRQASVASVSPWSTSGQVSESLQSWWAPTVRLVAGSPLPEIIETLNAWRPAVLVTYASMVRILAEEQRAGRLSIRPRVVFSTGEVQTPEDRRLGAVTWGREPFDQYATTETGILAAECREGRRRHLMDDLNVIEVVDDDDRPVPPGTWGSRVLVTPLANRVTPLIRYVLDDRLRLTDEPCPCGRQLRVVTGIQGRSEEVLRLPAGAGGDVQIDPQTYHPILDRLPVSGWQVSVDGDRFVVLLAGADRTGDAAIDDATVAAELDRVLTARGARLAHIDVHHVDEIPKTSAGKAPVVRPDDRADRWSDDRADLRPDPRSDPRPPGGSATGTGA